MRDTDMASEKRGSRIELLDLLRLVAILGVAAFHFGFLGPFGAGADKVLLPEWGPFARYGYLGVPAFFAVSGFVIAYSAQGRSAKAFAIARLARIYPGFLVCMTLTFVVTLSFGAPSFQTSATQWLANLTIAAPSFGEAYMDSPYWSLVIEVTFYAWVTALMALGAFPRRIDLIVLTWLSISLANELTIDARLVERVFLADYSGFFATGLLAYEISRGRRDLVVQGLLALSVATAAFHAVHGLEWLSLHTKAGFDPLVAATICVIAMTAVVWSPRLPRPPLPSKLVMAIGGLTYPFYLLHQQIGYVLFNRFEPCTVRNGVAVAAYIMGAILVSWVVWRFVEHPARRVATRMLDSVVYLASSRYRRLRGLTSELPHDGLRRF
jgi:peptidoglycan/LPS O-acetylase OafA/YrhL